MRPSAGRQAAGVLALVALCVAIYLPSLGFKYVQDSFHAVKANRVVERGDLVEIFTSDYWKGTVSAARSLYRPVTVASFALERRAAGDADSGLSHGVNAILHAAVALLLVAYARRLGAGDDAALAAGLLFVAHPVATQGVANVVGRSEILATGFSLCALLATSVAVGWNEDGSASLRMRRAAAWGAGGSVFLALGSKEVALALVPLLAAQIALSRAPVPARERLGALAPVALAGTLWLVLRTFAIEALPGLQRVPPEDNVLVGLDGLPRLATTIAMAGRYAGLLLWPARLSPDYSGGAIAVERSLLGGWAAAGAGAAVVVLALCAAPWIGRRSSDGGGRARGLSMAGLLLLLPYLTFGNVLVLNAAGFAERFLYFGTTGLALALAIGWGTAIERLRRAGRSWARPAGWAVLLALVLIGAFHARGEARIWESNRTMYARALEANPRGLRAYAALADIASRDGDPRRALELYDRGLEHAPDHADFHVARANLLAAARDLAGAEAAARRALDLEPAIGPAWLTLGWVERLTGRPEEAERALRKALLYQPDLLEAAAQLGHLLFEQRRYAEAARFYEGCIRAGRDDLRPNLAAALAAAG